MNIMIAGQQIYNCTCLMFYVVIIYRLLIASEQSHIAIQIFIPIVFFSSCLLFGVRPLKIINLKCKHEEKRF